MRADSLGCLTARGWEQLRAHGVRTVIDLRNEDERGEDAAPRPASVETIRIPLDETADREFWDDWESGPQFATPLYYGPHLRRFPRKSAEVLAAIVSARPGGVAFHCAGGRDRSGQIAILVLALARVLQEEIVADYLLSHERLPAMYAARGEEDQTPLVESSSERRHQRRRRDRAAARRGPGGDPRRRRADLARGCRASRPRSLVPAPAAATPPPPCRRASG
ncbi:MAG TPA: tyrosine-protein phosphatase, partial [Solirubrobacterales bacterium]